MSNEIFISIASCKERFLALTVKSALSNAKYPENLYFGIFNTVIDEEDILTDEFVLNHPNVIYMEARFPVPLGTGWSRLNASLLASKKHDYFLQIDSHTIFEKNWDEVLIESYKSLLDVCDKPIISSCGPFWAEDEYGNILLNDNPEDVVDPYNFDLSNTKYSMDGDKSFINSALCISKYHHNVVGRKIVVEEDGPFVEHGLIYASFLFSKFDFNLDIINDPRSTWEGDQINMSMRAFSNGYRCFTLKRTLLWPRNNWRDGNLISEYNWRKADGDGFLKKYKTFRDFLKTNSAYRQREIFSGKGFSYWGAKDLKSYQDFEQMHKVKLNEIYQYSLLGEDK
jgi:hypothetical protein